jgi:EmrB/QacA subfamily drug resistance transporter
LIREKWKLWMAFVSLNMGIFMVNVDSTMLTIALPILEQTFDTTLQGLQWIILGYLILITGILPTIGKLSDMVGKKKIYMLGLCCFTISSILCATALSLWQLVIYRIIQAIGASMIMANAMSLVSLIFPEGQKGRALSGISSVIVMATIIGPALGGFILSLFGWRSIFWIHIPLGIIALILSVLFLFDHHKAVTRETFDIKGSISFFIGITSLLLFLSEGSAWGWTSYISVLFLLLAVCSWFVFIYWEKRTENPLLDLSFFKRSSFLIGNTAAYISFVLMMIPSIVLPLYMTHILNLSVDKIGFIMAAQAIVIILVSPVSGWLSDKYHHTLPAFTGMLLCAVSLGMMGKFHEDTSTFMLILTLSIFGGGIGFFQASNNLSVLAYIPPDKNGVVGSIMATMRNFGRVSGVTFAIMLYQPLTEQVNALPEVDYLANLSRVFLFGFVLAVINVSMMVYLILKQKRSVTKLELRGGITKVMNK